jgi:hypothetical protein
MEFKSDKAKYIVVSLVMVMAVSGASYSAPGKINATESSISRVQSASRSSIGSASTQLSDNSSVAVLSLPDFAGLIARARPSVVVITTTATGFNFFGMKMGSLRY